MSKHAQFAPQLRCMKTQPQSCVAFICVPAKLGIQVYTQTIIPVLTQEIFTVHSPCSCAVVHIKVALAKPDSLN